jgi:hypothetical protein
MMKWIVYKRKFGHKYLLLLVFNFDNYACKSLFYTACPFGQLSARDTLADQREEYVIDFINVPVAMNNIQLINDYN